jgi:hypothetical protein
MVNALRLVFAGGIYIPAEALGRREFGRRIAGQFYLPLQH